MSFEVMDLISESSVVESVEDNEVIIPSENTVVRSNEDCSVEHVRDVSLGDMKSEGGHLFSSGSMGTNPQVKKGHGLKKWKRIPRESSKERGNSMDNGVVGKRGFSNASPDLRKTVVSAERKQRSEGLVSSTNGMVKSLGLFADSVVAVGLGPVFDAVADSENSEDRSSKSSTAASAPQRGSEIPAAGGFMGDSNTIISANGDHELAAERGQPGRSRTGTGKKARAEQVKIEKENSHCSVESDSQGSNFVFMQGANSVTSKGRQSRRSANYDGENSDDNAQGSEQHFAEELQSGFRKNMAEFEDVSQSYLPVWETKEGNCENNGLSQDQDPLLQSITTLECAQKALAEEVQKFRELGKDDILFSSDVVPDGSPSSLESDIVNLKQNVNELESMLEAARSMLKVKESKVIELETFLTSDASILKGNKEISDLEQRNWRELENELEGLFKQRIEAMIEYVVTSRTIKDLRLAVVDKITILEELKIVATEQAQLVSFSKSVGNKASMLQRQVFTVKPKKRICKFASLSFIQFVLLCVALCFFVLQMVPQYPEDVPT